METNKETLDVDYGLHVTFDGQSYQLLTTYSQDKYPVGGLLCEYLRLKPRELKPIILDCSHLDEVPNAETLYNVTMDFQNHLLEKYPPVIVNAVILEFYNIFMDWFEAVNSNRIDEFISVSNDSSSDQIKDFVYKDTGYSGAGGDTVLQLMLTAYVSAATTFAVIKMVFDKSFEQSYDDENSSMETLYSFYGAYADMQHIDFRIMGINGKLQSVYSIKTVISLFLFEMANCMKNEVTISKCKNCGNYFIPLGRSDSIYCMYPIEGTEDKTCKDVGAQNARALKERNDIATKEYRKLYMRLKMAATRHPDDKEKQEILETLSKQNKQKRKQMENDEISTEEYLNWIDQFK